MTRPSRPWALPLRRGPAIQMPLRLLASSVVVIAAAFAMVPSAQAQPHPGPDGGHGYAAGMGMMGMGGMPPIGHMLDSVNASADQRAQIQQIVQAAHTDLKALHESGRPLHEQMQALLAQPTVDARAAEALRQQASALHDQASKRVLQAMIDVSRVLTPEQRKTLADRAAQHRSMMERHRAEREALDKSKN